jgi:hypothetical protein
MSVIDSFRKIAAMGALMATVFLAPFDACATTAKAESSRESASETKERVQFVKTIRRSGQLPDDLRPMKIERASRGPASAETEFIPFEISGN